MEFLEWFERQDSNVFDNEFKFLKLFLQGENGISYQQ